jgi:hypothetical protein
MRQPALGAASTNGLEVRQNLISLTCTHFQAEAARPLLILTGRFFRYQTT